jgi:peptidoglycan hydrolase-like protein with peptidoglycan-binding domain
MRSEPDLVDLERSPQTATSTLRGDRGDFVKQIQEKLAIGTDGVFGANTEAALRQFQRDHGLVPDGIAGPRTWVAIGDA